MHGTLSRMGAAVAIVMLCAGCASSVRPLAVTPDMRRCAASNYERIVNNELPAGTAATVHPPKSLAVQYNPANDQSILDARGDLDTRRSNGVVQHGWYEIQWRQHGDATQNDSDEPWTYERCVVASR